MTATSQQGSVQGDMNRNERILIWLLRVGGVVMLTALGAVVIVPPGRCDRA
jgi:hypothetical protein